MTPNGTVLKFAIVVVDHQRITAQCARRPVKAIPSRVGCGVGPNFTHIQIRVASTQEGQLDVHTIVPCVTVVLVIPKGSSFDIT